jgi:hypothetical protein
MTTHDEGERRPEAREGAGGEERERAKRAAGEGAREGAVRSDEDAREEEGWSQPESSAQKGATRDEG